MPAFAYSMSAALAPLTAAALLIVGAGAARAQDDVSAGYDLDSLRAAAQARADRRVSLLPDLRRRLDAGEGYKGDLGVYAEADPDGQSAGAKLSARSLAYWAESRFLKQIDEAREMKRKRLGLGAKDAAPPALKPVVDGDLDFWLEGRSTRTEDAYDAVTADSRVAFGAERSLGSGFFLGVMTQLDRREYAADSAQVDREGWLTGPYLLARPIPEMTVEALAGFGQAARESDDAEAVLSEGYVLRGRVQGEIDVGAALIAKPEASVLFQHELGAPLEDPDAAAAGLARGNISFGPRLERSFEMEDLAWAGDVKATPFAKMGGNWRFGPDRAADPFSARSEAGFEATLENGWSIQGSSYLDGVGAEAENTYGGKIDFTLQLP